MEATEIIRKFEGKDVQILLDERGDPWFPGEAIGELLEYPNPRKAIDQMFQRHRGILEKPRYSSVLILRTEAGSREARFYSWRGVYLLTMRSRQPKAFPFQEWLADLAEKERQRFVAKIEGRVVEKDQKLVQMEKALDPDRKKLLDEYYEADFRAWQAEKESKRLTEENKRLWAANEYPRQPEHYQWAQILRIARECNLNL
ncbi:MAG: Bro-N domain-containing protein, partial [Gammaproteobacteria bacterium]|nr:Bro-N domain-containing protein [Gammaproteobacteria bacterium]